MKKGLKIIVGILGILIVVIALFIGIFLFEMKPDKEKKAQLEKDANAYLTRHFNEDFEIYEILFDNMGNFQAEYLAKAREKKEYINFYIYYDEETKQLVDTYIARRWEKEIEEKVRPYLEEKIEGISTTLVYFEDETIGKTLNIKPLSGESYKDYDIAPTLLINIDRKKEKEDEAFLDECIAFLQEEMGLAHGSIILIYIDETSVVLEDRIERIF